MFRKNHSFSAAYMREDVIYFSENGMNGLFMLDKKSDKVTFLGIFEGERADCTYLHRKCFSINDKLYFLPENAKYIHIYDMNTKTITGVPLNVEKNRWLADACVLNNKIYMFPHNLNAPVTVMDVETNTIFSDENFSDIKSEICLKTSEVVFFTKALLRKNHIILPLYMTSFIIDYDPCENTIAFIDTKIDNTITIFESEDGYLAYTKENELLILNNDFSVLNTVEIPHFQSSGMQFTSFVDSKDGILAVPKMVDNIYYIDKNSYSFNKLDFPEEFAFYPSVNVKFYGYHNSDSYLYMFPQGSDYLLEINTSTLEMKASVYLIPFGDYSESPYKEAAEIRKRRLTNQKILKESYILNLEAFLEVIK